MAQGAPERRAVLVGVVGPSGAGKTTLLELLIPALSQLGVRAGAVKHASHGFVADRPGKDSHRLYASGAAAVAIVSNEQVACFRRRSTAAGEAGSLGEGLDALPRDLDLVLVEGFSWEPVPRIVVLGGRRDARTREHLESGEVLAVLRPRPVRTGAPARPHFPDAQIRSLAVRVAELVGARGATTSGGAGRPDLSRGTGARLADPSGARASPRVVPRSNGAGGERASGAWHSGRAAGRT